MIDRLYAFVIKFRIANQNKHLMVKIIVEI